jgi:hypothetical protein
MAAPGNLPENTSTHSVYQKCAWQALEKESAKEILSKFTFLMASELSENNPPEVLTAVINPADIVIKIMERVILKIRRGL